mgnify:FL=1
MAYATDQQCILYLYIACSTIKIITFHVTGYTKAQ